MCGNQAEGDGHKGVKEGVRFGSGECTYAQTPRKHTHTHKHTREAKGRSYTGSKLSLRLVSGQGHGAEDTCGASRIPSSYQMQIVWL